MKKLLLHCCCGPCAVYPVSVLKDEWDITTYFYNHNIHPYREFKKRLTTLESYAREVNIPFVASREYELKEFLRKAVFNEDKRCSLCYDYRLKKTAEYARENGFDSFTSTLLYSKYQNHGSIVKTAEKYAKEFSLDFLYSDFRTGWQQGIDESIARDMYRQPYCGCIYSEQERYDKRFRKRKKK